MLNVILGGSGLVGTNLAKTLVERGEKVSVADRTNPTSHFCSDINFLQADIVTERQEIRDWIQSQLAPEETINLWHLAANSDIQSGIEDPFIDFIDTFDTTVAALEICKYLKVEFFGFSSSSAVYGDKEGKPVNEEELNLVPISNYGLMKLWSETMITEFLGLEGSTRSLIFRFPNVVGLPLTHGIVRDLRAKFLLGPTQVEVLGDGNQRKQYIHVEELVNLMLGLKDRMIKQIEVFNIAPHDFGITVREIAETLREVFSPGTDLVFGKTKYGWKGDVPIYFLRTEKLRRQVFQLNLIPIKH